jgi:excisionase family DNA binding protein
MNNQTSNPIGPARPLIGKLRTVDEYADLWGVSPRTVQRQIKSGALRAHRIGRLVRISDADAAAFLNKNREDEKGDE